jgi:hypothetical protein
MPIGNSIRWLTGSLVFVFCIALAPRSWAEDLTPAEDATSQSADAAPLGIHDNASSPAPIPSDSVSANECAENCDSYCGIPLCSPPGRFWMRADALLWWTNGTHLPSLVTTNQTLPPSLTNPGTVVAFGDATYLNDGRGGVRTTLGGWLDRCHRWGIEADWFSLSGRSIDYSLDGISQLPPQVGRPFYNVSPAGQAPDREVVVDPNTSGTVSVHNADSFGSAGVTGRFNLSCGGCGACDTCGDPGCRGCGEESCDLVDCSGLCMDYSRIDLLFGYRHYSYNDGLTIHESLDHVLTATHSEIHDNFMCRNEFNGVELGLSTELRHGRWSVNILTKMALGMSRQMTDITGSTVFTNQGGSIVYSEGVFAGRYNIGSYRSDQFVVIPQLGLELGYQMTTHTRAFIGYNLLYWGNVIKAGNQVDLNLDPRNFPGSTETGMQFPQFLNRTTAFWAQGINLGAEIRF